MNKQIKELIIKAGGHWNYGDFNMPNSVEFQEQDIEKFAELIIRNCANIIDSHNVMALPGEPGRNANVNDLKNHFGVK
jgi:hypothetical protein